MRPPLRVASQKELKAGIASTNTATLLSSIPKGIESRCMRPPICGPCSAVASQKELKVLIIVLTRGGGVASQKELKAGFGLTILLSLPGSIPKGIESTLSTCPGGASRSAVASQKELKGDILEVIAEAETSSIPKGIESYFGHAAHP